MIFVVVAPPNYYTVTAYFETWGKSLASRIKLLTYQDLFCARHLQAGTYIFGDVERLNGRRAAAATEVWDNLAAAGDHVRLLNHPTRSMRRYELLRTLHEQGSNAFTVYRLTDSRTPRSFPVFLRNENDHHGSLTALLHTQAELDAAIRKYEPRRRGGDNLLIVEYCDTGDADGLFRKYGAFIIGERIIPTHLFFSQRWLAKVESVPKQLTSEMVEEERDYVQENPFEEGLKEVARLARIDYGRVDFAVLDGKVQVWEINTNPHLPRLNFAEDVRRLTFEHSMRHMNAAFEAIDCHADPAIRISTSVDQGRVQHALDCLHSAVPTGAKAYLQRRRKNLQKLVLRSFR